MALAGRLEKQGRLSGSCWNSILAFGTARSSSTEYKG
jgi:hypothetical protein